MWNAKEGQIYICTKSDRPWWTKGKEYEVARNKYGELCFVDDDGTKWAINYLKYHGCEFKQKDTSRFNNYEKLRFSMDELSDEKEKLLDLNKLTIYQLQEYIDLQQALELAKRDLAVKLAKKELAENKLDNFIESRKQNEI